MDDEHVEILWTDYMQYRARLREFDLAEIERVVRYSSERYVDTVTMNKIRMMYFDQEDILHLTISDESEAGSVELDPNITVELNDKGDMIGIEILEASRFIRDSIMDSVQARVLRVTDLQPA